MDRKLSPELSTGGPGSQVSPRKYDLVVVASDGSSHQVVAPSSGTHEVALLVVNNPITGLRAKNTFNEHFFPFSVLKINLS